MQEAASLDGLQLHRFGLLLVTVIHVLLCSFGELSAVASAPYLLWITGQHSVVGGIGHSLSRTEQHLQSPAAVQGTCRCLNGAEDPPEHKADQHASVKCYMKKKQNSKHLGTHTSIICMFEKKKKDFFNN